jgi:hypothetical protein
MCHVGRRNQRIKKSWKHGDITMNEIDAAVKVTAEECAMMAYEKGDHMLACDILDRYVWKLSHDKEGNEIHDLFPRKI